MPAKFKFLLRHKAIIVALAIGTELIRRTGGNRVFYRWLRPGPYAYGREIEPRAVQELVEAGFLKFELRKIQISTIFKNYSYSVVLNGGSGQWAADQFIEVQQHRERLKGVKHGR